MRTACFAVVLVLGTGCDLDFRAQKDLPSGLARRIAQKRNEFAQKPQDAQAARELGELYIEGERWFEAAETLSTARRLGGDDTRTMGGLAVTYMSLGYYEQVEKLLRDCFKRNRQEPGCLYAAGELMMLVGSQPALEAARSVWSNFVAVAPDHIKAAYVRSQLDQLNARLGPPGAAPSSQPATAASQPGHPPTSAAADNGMPPGHPPPGAAASGNGTPLGHPPTGAAATGNGTPPGHPPTAPAGAQPGVPAHAAGSANQDVGQLNAFGVAIQKALAAVRNNDAVGAEAAYKDALKLRPNDVAALAGLAEAEFAQNRLDDAVTTIEKAWTNDPKDAQVRWVFGLVMLQARKRTSDAIAAWEALQRDTPEYARQLQIDVKLQSARKFMGAP